MIINKATSVFLFGILFSMSSIIMTGQTGYITGTIYDSDGKTTLPVANIYLKDAINVGTFSDLDGTYLFKNLKVGTYTIIYSYTGFENQEVSLEIFENQATVKDIVMQPMAILGKEVIITAQALGQAKAINQQRNSDAIANIVSADKIKELPDVNAAEAISRLPGVAINRNGGEGSKVVVRGLDPKFTAISINGVRLPATGGSDRSVDLSLISPELLSGIELFKSPTPDMDGDALGGSINLNILKAPKARKISIKGLNGYNFFSKTLQDYKATISLTQRILDDKIGIIATVNTERFNRGGETIGQGWGDDQSVVVDTALNIFKQQGNYLEFQKRQEQRKRQNASLGIDFKLGDKTDITILGIYSKTSRDRYNQSERYDIQNNRIRYLPNIVENSISLYSASVSMNHNLSFAKIDWGGAFSRVKGETPYDFTTEFWNASNPYNKDVFKSRSQPSTFYDFITRKPEGDYLQGATSVVSGNSEDIKTAFANIAIPIVSGNKINLTFKTGGKISLASRVRTYDERYVKNYYLFRNSHFLPFDPEGKGAVGVDPSNTFYYGMSNFTNNENLTFQNASGASVALLTSYDENKLRKFSEVFSSDLRENRYQLTNNYNLTENVYATYAMFKLNLGNKITLISGIRYEKSDNNYQGIYSDLSGDFGESGALKDVLVDRNYGIILPHLHLKYKPVEWFDIRASYSTTLARPDYDYVVPFTSINRSSDVVITQGNANLNASVSRNYDLYATAFSGNWGLLSIGAFYKQIDDAFYPLIVGLNNDSLAVAYGFPKTGYTGAELTTYTNSPKSNVKGIEVDLQSNLNFLPKPFDGLVLNINYSRLFSNTTINSFYEESRLAGNFPFFYTIVDIISYQREANLIGQAKHILNASLGYDYKKFSARFSTSYQGTKISGYSANADKDRFNQGFWRFDAVVKQKFGNNFNVFVNMNNISDQKGTNFFRSEDLVTSIERYGSTVTFGAEFIIR
ncbi:MAG: TonB-dependent receptor [Saprospiraceae bacterium]|jgi:TonB-dependent receptor|nr:TonB-dependent receptor [Saprospiraceae bacterium]